MVDAQTASQGSLETLERYDDREDVIEHIKDQVLDRLGRPENLQRVIVKPLWDNCYRANVICSYASETEWMTLTQSKIDDSFFIQTSPEGGILRAEPEIKKKY